jgi:hypothetical protein
MNKPTTLPELIAYLQSLPSDTVLQVLETRICGYDTLVETAPLVLNENTDFVDLTGNPFIKEGQPNFNKKFLCFGIER